jgi:hypothetical protein
MYIPLARRAFKLMEAAPVEGCLVEFGVYKGDGLRTMSRLAKEYLQPPPALYGFDSFEGMPSTAAPLESGLAHDWGRGTFSDVSLETVQGYLDRNGVRATLVKGVFSDLSSLADYGIEKVRFAHIDADIYEGYRDALRLLTPHIQVGTVMLFDEVMPLTDPRYQSMRMHGKRAFADWERATGLNLHLIRFESSAALYIVVDEPYLERSADTIIHLRRDEVKESLVNIARCLLGETTFTYLKRARRYALWRHRG